MSTKTASAEKGDPAKESATRISANSSRTPAGSPASDFRSVQQGAGNLAVQQLFRRGAIKAKLSISQPNDPDEQEADEVADRIMRMPDLALSARCPGCSAGGEPCRKCAEKSSSQIQRKANGTGGPHQPYDASHVVGNLGTGHPLDKPTRAFFETQLGADLSQVRVHTGTAPAAMSDSISAKAFTVGRDIAFAADQYSTDSSKGLHLLAHELAHTLQQSPDRGEDSMLRRQAAEINSGTTARSMPPQTTTLSAGTIDPDRLGRIRMILNKGGVGPMFNPGPVLESIWDSFGANLPAVAEENFTLWQECIEVGAQLYDIPNARKYRDDFSSDVKDTAILYLKDNRDFILRELQRFGLLEGKPPDPEERDRALNELQKAATIVGEAKRAQIRLQQIPVGYNEEAAGPGTAFKTFTEIALFSPFDRPMQRPRGDEHPAMAKWEEIKIKFDELSDVIQGQANRYPTLASLIEKDQAETVARKDQSQALAVVNTTLREVLGNIERTVPKISTDDLDYRDLKPIHDQLIHGSAPASRRNWKEKFFRGVIDADLADHETKKFWIDLSLGTLAAAAFLVAEFATLGSATFFIAAGVGISAGGIQAASSWEHYLDIAEAARTSMIPGRSLVTSGQASVELLNSIIYTAFLLADLYVPGARVIRGAAGAAEKAQELATKRALLQADQRALAERAAREAAEIETVRTTSESAAEAVSRRTGEAASRSLIRRIQEVISEFIEAVKRWADQVFKQFGFRSYIVEVEGEWISLYGIRSRVLLGRFRRDSLESWIIDRSHDLEPTLVWRESQLAAAKIAKIRGDDALTAMLRTNAIHISEQIGEYAAEFVIKKRFPSAVLVHRGSGSRTLDLIFRLSDGSILIVEAKGGAGRIITREIAPGVHAPQGTVAYLRSVLDAMESRGENIAKEVREALNKKRLRYFLSETPIPRGASELETSLREFPSP